MKISGQSCYNGNSLFDKIKYLVITPLMCNTQRKDTICYIEVQTALQSMAQPCFIISTSRSCNGIQHEHILNIINYYLMAVIIVVYVHFEL